MAETLMWMVGEDLAHMQARSKDFKRAMTNFGQDGNQDCWIQAYSFISLYWDDLELIKKYGCVDEEGQPMEVDERAHSAGVEELKAHGRRMYEEYVKWEPRYLDYEYWDAYDRKQQERGLGNKQEQEHRKQRTRHSRSTTRTTHLLPFYSNLHCR